MSGLFAWAGEHEALLLCVVCATLVTVLPKVLPVTFLRGDSLPPLLRRWLDFVPVAVMAALVAPDIFIYDGRFDLSTGNLFLMVSIPTFLVAWKTKNYFVTIAVGIGLVILARWAAWAV
ncbi:MULTISPECIES: AzlD domain-containing protein [unclassified Desulfovibrio]|uniref:AzlD domain-containing protein n=1 Tax=unclassified Desulfovibrio TaxID=2593640 RepID=UPI0013ECF2FB|nr:MULTISPECIES: AzlD domain-containing protein [unclassified Desulfovibrio]